MMEFLNDNAVLAALGVLIGSIGGYFLYKSKFKGIDTEVAAKVLISMLKAVEGQTAEGTTVDTLLDNMIPELEKRFGIEKATVIVDKVATVLSGNK